MGKDVEIIEGYVVDIACLRKYHGDDLLDRAKTHTRACSLEGHCLESGYGLVGATGRFMLLDPQATPQIVRVVEASRRDQGIRARAKRRQEEGRQVTVELEEID